MDDKPLAISVSRAATLIGVSRRTVERHIRFRNLRAVRIGGRVLIPVAALEEFLGANRPLRATPGTAPEVADAVVN